MPVPDTSGVPPFADFDALKTKLNEIVGKYNNLLVSLDDMNFDKITANVLDVQQLSAITADLGTITAGLIQGIQIFGSYIATANGTYPRSEMNVDDDFFAALASATNFVKMVPAGLGSPALVFDDGVTHTEIRSFNGVDFFFYISSNNDIVLESDGNIELNATSSVLVPSWSNLSSVGESESLQDALDSKANAFTGYSGDVSTDTQIMHFTNGILTSVTTIGP